MDPIWYIVIAIVVIAILVVIIIVALKPKPLVMREFEDFQTTGDIPDDPTTGRVSLQIGMKQGDAGATVAILDFEETSMIRLRHVNQVELPDFRKNTALGVMLLFNSNEQVTYPPQELTIKGKDRHGRPVPPPAPIKVPQVRGKDGENAYLYVDTKGRLYWATKSKAPAAQPDMDWSQACKAEYRVLG